MKKRILAFLTAFALVFGMMPAAFADNTLYRNETPYESSEYMKVLEKDAQGKTTNFAIDFEKGISSYNWDNFYPTYVYDGSSASTTSQSAALYVRNYGKDAGEWNGALDRSRLFATNDEVAYTRNIQAYTHMNNEIIDTDGKVLGQDYWVTMPGQLFHNQWTVVQENAWAKGEDGNYGYVGEPVDKLYINQNVDRIYGAFITQGYGNHAAYTPNVVPGGKFFPEIMAFSGRPKVHTGSNDGNYNVTDHIAQFPNRFSFDEEAQINSVSSIFPNKPKHNFTGLQDGVGFADNLTVRTLDNKKVLYMAPSNWFEPTSGADFTVFGKDDVALANRKVVFETRMKVTRNYPLAGPNTAKMDKAFTLQITKNADFNTGYLNSVKHNGILYSNSIDRINQFSKDADGNYIAEYLDCVTFAPTSANGGYVYLGKHATYGDQDYDGLEVGSYETNTWYTLRYYLDTTTDVPTHSIELIKDDGTVVAQATDEVVLDEYGTFGWNAGDDLEAIEKHQVFYQPFSGFGENDKYGIFLRVDCQAYGNVSFTEFGAAFDHVSFGDIKDLTGEVNGKSVTATYKSLEPTIRNATVVAAEYEGDKLVQTAISTITVPKGGLSGTANFDFENEVGEDSDVRLFLWKDNIIPVTESVDIK